MLNKVKILILILLFAILLGSCNTADYSGTYVGYSWKDESEGVALEDAKQKIETAITLDKNGVITDASILFWKLDGEGNWYTRQDTKSEVAVDFSKMPSIAVPENGERKYAAGESMFQITTHDKMGFYAAAANANGTAVLLIVEPYTRYQFEIRLPSDFDFTTSMKDITIGSGLAVPTIQASSSGFVKPKEWNEYADFSVLSFHADPYVITGEGIFAGLSEESSIMDYMKKAGIQFVDGKPTESSVSYGFFGKGGWEGNYKAIENYLIGRDATELTSLVDWNIARYEEGVNSDNFFGVDTPAGATKTAQNSSDTIAGATVRMSRESTSYQRALVEAGILKEEDVIKGRF